MSQLQQGVPRGTPLCWGPETLQNTGPALSCSSSRQWKSRCSSVSELFLSHPLAAQLLWRGECSITQGFAHMKGLVWDRFLALSLEPAKLHLAPKTSARARLSLPRLSPAGTYTRFLPAQ